MSRPPLPVRWRFALWASLALGAMVAASGVASWLTLGRVLADQGDRFLVEARDAFVGDLRAERAAGRPAAAALATAMRAIHFADVTFVVFDGAGRVVGPPAGGATGGRRARPLEPALLDALRRRAMAVALSDEPATIAGPAGHRMAAARVRVDDATWVVTAVQSRRWMEGVLRNVRTAYLAAIPVVLLLATGGGYLLARRALAPVTAISRRARAIEASRLHERVPVGNPHDELGELATMINDLLARLEESFAQQRRFVADASHELRTPVALLRAEADVALARPSRAEAEYRDALAVVRRAGERLSRVVDDLLFLAKADGRPAPLRREPLDLATLVVETAHSMAALAARHGVRLAVRVPPAAPFVGDADLLGRMLLNLVDNAVRHSPSGATVAVRLSRADDGHRLEVADEGPGIPPEDQERVFERFYRVSGARTRASGAGNGGAGLGLAIARWVAEAHGGSLVLAWSSPSGSRFQARLPAAPPVPAAPAARLTPAPSSPPASSRWPR